VTYLDTGCLVKLYYPEPDSAKVVALIQGKTICYTPFHELEFVNALQLKVFMKGATLAQVTAARQLIDGDLKSGTLVSPSVDWKRIFAEVVRLAEKHTGAIGCQSLDTSAARRLTSWRQTSLSARIRDRSSSRRPWD